LCYAIAVNTALSASAVFASFTVYATYIVGIARLALPACVNTTRAGAYTSDAGFVVIAIYAGRAANPTVIIAITVSAYAAYVDTSLTEFAVAVDAGLVSLAYHAALASAAAVAAPGAGMALVVRVDTSAGVFVDTLAVDARLISRAYHAPLASTAAAVIRIAFYALPTPVDASGARSTIGLVCNTVTSHAGLALLTSRASFTADTAISGADSLMANARRVDTSIAYRPAVRASGIKQRLAVVDYARIFDHTAGIAVRSGSTRSSSTRSRSNSCCIWASG